MKTVDVNALRDALYEADAISMRGVAILNNFPTVDAVEVVHGRWIGTQYDGYADGCPVYDLWECSECREEYESEGDPPLYKCCPNCGAKMDLEERREWPGE